MARQHGFRRCRFRACGVAAIASLVLVTAPGSSAGTETAVRIWTISYTAHNGADRRAHVALPAWYKPGRNPPLPVVISPHGRGGDGRANARFWGDLPAVGQFAVINPDGMGRRFERFSYGYDGQIDDLAKMPDLVARALPWLRIDRTRIYALGTSMGGQETLLLVARHPRLLAGAVAMDSVTNLARRYYQLPKVPCNEDCVTRWGEPYGRVLQAAMREEVGGTPEPGSGAHTMGEARLRQVRTHRAVGRAAPGVVVVAAIRSSSTRSTNRPRWSANCGGSNHCGPIVSYAGTWRHSQAMWAGSLLPIALAGMGLLPDGFLGIPDGRRQGACVPTAGLSGIPALIATGIRCQLAPGVACA